MDPMRVNRRDLRAMTRPHSTDPSLQSNFSNALPKRCRPAAASAARTTAPASAAEASANAGTLPSSHQAASQADRPGHRGQEQGKRQDQNLSEDENQLLPHGFKAARGVLAQLHPGRKNQRGGVGQKKGDAIHARHHQRGGQPDRDAQRHRGGRAAKVGGAKQEGEQDQQPLRPGQNRDGREISPSTICQPDMGYNFRTSATRKSCRKSWRKICGP